MWILHEVTPYRCQSLRLHHLYKYSLVKRIKLKPNGAELPPRFPPFVCLHWQQKTRVTGTILTVIKHRWSNPCKGIAAYLGAVQCGALDKEKKAKNIIGGMVRRKWFFNRILRNVMTFLLENTAQGVINTVLITRLYCDVGSAAALNTTWWICCLWNSKIFTPCLMCITEDRKKWASEFLCLGKRVSVGPLWGGTCHWRSRER